MTNQNLKTGGNFLLDTLEDAISLRQQIFKDSGFQENFSEACALLLKVRNQKGCIYSCGNGGSACDAMHFNEELVARYKKERIGIKAQHFMDSGVLSCWSNDYNYESIFSRQVDTFCTANDCLVCLSTSGNSKNIIKALQHAREKGTSSILLAGGNGGESKEIADISLIVPHHRTDRIQEIHITLIHAFCEFLEQDL